MDRSLQKIVIDRINNYIEFDSSILFKRKNGLVAIFGGAIRDSIANKEIHDIDILIGSDSYNFVSNKLMENGYEYLEDLCMRDIYSMYKDISFINEPHTYIKGNKKIQLIRPSAIKKSNSYSENFEYLLRNVDIRCCGLSYDGDTINENIKGALSDCQRGIIFTIEENIMNQFNRTIRRVDKLGKRGWSHLRNEKEVRLFKINELNDELWS